MHLNVDFGSIVGNGAIGARYAFGDRNNQSTPKQRSRMLVLSRKLGERIQIGDDICLSITKISRNRIAIGIEAPREVSVRREELDQEWDVERALECNASALAFSGVVLSATVDKKWLLLPGLVTGFLFQHALQGWCPPLPILRRMGLRTCAKINEERYALKALRGDFEQIIFRDGAHVDPQAVVAAASPS